MAYIFLFEESPLQQKAYSDIANIAAQELTKRLVLIVCDPDKIKATVNDLNVSAEKIVL